MSERNYYFDNLHVYDIVATMNKINGLKARGLITQVINEEVQVLLHTMRHTHLIDNDSFWPLLEEGNRGYILTSDWFFNYGVHAAIPDDDPSDVVAGALLIDQENQDMNGGRYSEDILPGHVFVDVFDQDVQPDDVQIDNMERLRDLQYAIDDNLILEEDFDSSIEDFEEDDNE